MKPFARINGECCQCGSVASTNTNEVWPQRTQRTQREENDDEEIDGGDGVHSDGRDSGMFGHSEKWTKRVRAY